MDKARRDALRVGFDRAIKLEFHGAKVTSDAGLFPYRDLGLRPVGREELPARAQLLQEAHRVAAREDVEGKENHRAEIRDHGETARQAGRDANPMMPMAIASTIFMRK